MWFEILADLKDASFYQVHSNMNKEELIEILKRVLGTDVDFSFLLQLKKKDLETLVACIRAGMGK